MKNIVLAVARCVGRFRARIAAAGAVGLVFAFLLAGSAVAGSVLAIAEYGVRYIPMASPPSNCTSGRACTWTNSSDNNLYYLYPNGTQVNLSAPGPASAGVFSVMAYGAKGDGTTDDTAAIQAAINACTAGGSVFAPNATYKTTATLALKSGCILTGAGKNATIIAYTGTGSAVSLDSTISAGIRSLQIQVNNNAATARGISLLNATGNNEFNVINDVTIAQTNTPSAPVAGQVGILLNATTTFALYWNSIGTVVLSGWDKGIRLVGYASNAPNQNLISDVVGYSSNYVLDLSSYVNDTVAHGVRMSASGYASSVACVNVGDGAVASQNNQIYGIVADTGASGRAFQINAGAIGTYVTADNESSSGNIDNGTNTTKVELYAAQSISTVGKLVVAEPAFASGSPNAMTVTGGAHTNLAASTEDIGVNFNMSATKQFATGNFANQREVVIQAPTYTAVGASTITTATTLSVTGAPTCNANMTCTNKWALNVEAGQSNFANTIVGTLAQMSTGIQVATNGVIDSYNGSATINFCGTNATTCNYGKAGAAWTPLSLLQTGIPAKANATIASSATVAPTQFITHISGTTTINTITAPTNFAQTNGGGCLVLVFDGVAPWSAAGNIFVAGTPTTAGTSVTFCYDNATSKWYPSRLASLIRRHSPERDRWYRDMDEAA